MRNISLYFLESQDSISSAFVCSASQRSRVSNLELHSRTGALDGVDLDAGSIRSICLSDYKAGHPLVTHASAASPFYRIAQRPTGR